MILIKGNYPVIIRPSMLTSYANGEFDISLYIDTEVGSMIKEKPTDEQVKYLLAQSYLSTSKYVKEVQSLVKKHTSINIGSSENSFASFMRENSRYEALQGRRMQHYFPPKDALTGKYYGPEVVRHYYYPDILIVDESAGIVIDIEIDEPYHKATGEPMHFVNIAHKLESNAWCNDNYRDEFFADIGIWTVRFAEEQVVRHPHACLDFISSLVKAFKENPLQLDNAALATFQNKDILVQQWTYTDAAAMSTSNYRDSYMPLLKEMLTSKERFKPRFRIIDDTIKVEEVAKELWALMNKTETNGTK